MDALIEVMARLRSKDGCPWDQQQDHRTLKPYAVEEVYELLDAIDEALETGDDRGLIEELGDLLLQVVFHAQIASETGRFDLQDVIDGLRTKLIRRHPHVFGDEHASDAEAVTKRWDAIKAQERSQVQGAKPRSILDGIPQGLPALVRAKEVQERAAKVGFEWDAVDGALQKVAEEVQEVVAAQQEGTMAGRRLEEEWGDLLFSLVNVARYSQIDPETALLGATRRFIDRFTYIEEAAARQGRSLESMSLEEMDALWDEAKHAMRRA